LRAFLMSRRARLQPADVGLPDTRRRRTPGLRREEVAVLAGLSTAWYTLFEMAKETRVSRKALAAIARALKLSSAEARHLAVLANAVGPASPADERAAADPVMQGILDGFRSGPALLLNDRTDVLAMNDIAIALFGNLREAPGDERNWLWVLFADRSRIENREDAARGLAAMFRATYCEHAQEPPYNELLDALLATSDAFARSWREHDVRPLEDVQPLVLDHPLFGALRFAFRALPAAGDSHARCCFLVPDEETTHSQAYARLVRALDARRSIDAAVQSGA
jgi:hypothetical protein